MKINKFRNLTVQTTGQVKSEYPKVESSGESMAMIMIPNIVFAFY